MVKYPHLSASIRLRLSVIFVSLIVTFYTTHTPTFIYNLSLPQSLYIISIPKVYLIPVRIKQMVAVNPTVKHHYQK